MINPIEQCLLLKTGNSIVLLGDSHADQFLPMLKSYATANSYELLNLNLENGHDFPYDYFLRSYSENKLANPNSLGYLLEQNNLGQGDFLVLTFHRGKFNDLKYGDAHIPLNTNIKINEKYLNFIANIEPYFIKFQQRKVKIILILDTPLLRNKLSVESCHKQIEIFGKSSCSISFNEDRHTRYLQETAFNKIAQDVSNVYVWDPLPIIYKRFGNLSEFDAVDSQGNYLMKDWNHISNYLSLNLTSFFSDNLKSYLLRN